jgi:hypothetical protein
MVEGTKALLNSKKGMAFGSTAATLVTLAVQGVIPGVLGAQLVTGLAGVHIFSQALVDIFKERNKSNVGKDPKTGL